MEINESTYDDTKRQAHLSSGQTVFGFHDSNSCLGEHCPVHKPSNHELRGFPLRFNFDAFIFERIIPTTEENEETFIPDPDDYTLVSNGGRLIYRNSAKCLECDEELVSFSRYDFKTCSCRNLSVDGGHLYLRRVANNGTFIDTSIIYENGEFKKSGK
jgi:hypothetical protein